MLNALNDYRNDKLRGDDTTSIEDLLKHRCTSEASKAASGPG